MHRIYQSRRKLAASIASAAKAEDELLQASSTSTSTSSSTAAAPEGTPPLSLAEEKNPNERKRQIEDVMDADENDDKQNSVVESEPQVAVTSSVSSSPPHKKAAIPRSPEATSTSAPASAPASETVFSSTSTSETALVSTSTTQMPAMTPTPIVPITSISSSNGNDTSPPKTKSNSPRTPMATSGSAIAINGTAAVLSQDQTITAIDLRTPPPSLPQGVIVSAHSEVSIVNPPPPPPASIPIHPEMITKDPKGNNSLDKNNEDDEDDIQVISSTTINPNIQYPHKRIDCGVFSFSIDPSKFCDKCYCVVCDIPAKDCSNWGDHSVQKCRPAKSKSDDCMTDFEDYDAIDEILLESPTTTARNYYTRQRRSVREPQEVDASEARGRNEERTRQRERPPGGNDDKLRILEVLSRKLRSELRISEGGRTLTSETESSQNAKQQQQKNAMEGDIPQLGLHSSFFVEGIKIGWPFPAIMLPQRQMAIHIIKGLKRKLHVVLESPTGTGKSVAILCSVLAWQRYHMQTNALNPYTSTGEDEEKIPQIIYCSRTHSQVAQMVASLKKTPYRPTMTVLGSRQRLCIHKELTGAKKKQNKVPLNLACTARRRNTELYRRNALKRHEYDDDNPRTWDNGDIVGEGATAGGAIDGDEGEDGARPRKKVLPTCPHFRQLTSERTTSMAVKQLMGSHRFRANNGGGCCGSSSAVGGEESTFGVHDMEDLVRFGKNPYTEENIAVYRGKTGKFGFLVNDNSNHRGETTRGCHIVSLVKDGAAAFEARLQDGDKILKINGKDVRTWNKRRVVELLGQTPKEQPARLNVLRACSDTPRLLNPEDDFIGVEDMDNPEAIYSDHSVCPYYLSRTMQAHAELTFAPYNYILDPSIRSKMNISLDNAVVVLDEAHNVESTLCEGGSGKYGEMDLFQLVPILGNFAHRTEKTGNITLINTQVEVDTAKVAHELLLFVEKIIFHLQKLREKFENSPTPQKLENDYKKYRNIPHDHQVELSYDGPTGYGINRVAVGCQPFLTQLGIEEGKCAQLLEYAESMENELFGGNSNNEDVKPSDNAVDQNPNVLSVLVELLSKLVTATENPEHYYISCVVQANGNLDHAFGFDDYDNSGSGAGSQRFKKKPRKVPFMRPRSEERPNAFLPLCQHDWCKLDDECNFVDGARYGVRHGDYCDGSTPAWECHLVLRLLSPGLLMREIAHQCRSVILASGSLAPLPSVCAELNLFGKDSSSDSTNRYSMISGNKLPTIPQSLLDSIVSGRAKKLYSNRLQTTPKPLEANHVVNLQKQLLAVSIGNFPSGEKMTVTQKNYGNNPSFLPKFGHAVASVIEGIPKGGCLVFLPSYSFLKKCVSCWNQEPYNSNTYQNSHRGRYYANNGVSRDDSHNTSVWDRFLRSKGKIIVEPTGGQEEFEAARDEYKDTIRASGSCILLAVFRGKMSEGIDFNDDNARAVICVGLPLPNWMDRSVKAKQAYNEEQRKLRKKTCLLPGRDFYNQQAYRAIAQALGRCIRHGADYGTVILMDSRHCHDGSPTAGSICRAHSNLPKWMRGSVQTLSMEREDRRVNGQQQPKMIYGGYAGLKREMRQFFAQAPKASREVRAKWKADRERAISSSSSGSNVVFHRDTGNWTTVSEASSRPGVEETSHEKGVQI